MRKIVLLILTALPLFAGFFPETVQTSISDVKKKSIILSSPFPVNGMSGVVIHKYSKDLEAITHRVVQKTAKEIKILNKNILHHDELPTIKTPIFLKDKVIGGYLYDSVLLLAPNAQTYAKITSFYDKKWVHPDVFALYLSKLGENVPTRKNLKSFAQAYEVGLICIVGKGTIKLLDPISGYIVAKQAIDKLPPKGEAPFFMRFDEIESGMFTADNKQGYYRIMDQL